MKLIALAIAAIVVSKILAKVTAEETGYNGANLNSVKLGGELQ